MKKKKKATKKVIIRKKDIDKKPFQLEFDNKKYLETQNLKLRTENAGLRANAEVLERKLKEIQRNRLQFIDVDLGDPSPKDQEKRRHYVSSVANLHHDILRPKFTQMLSVIHNILENENNTRDQDQALKGTLYALREIIRWGDLLTSEDASYNQNPSDNPKEENKQNEN